MKDEEENEWLLRQNRKKFKIRRKWGTDKRSIWKEIQQKKLKNETKTGAKLMKKMKKTEKKTIRKERTKKKE